MNNHGLSEPPNSVAEIAEVLEVIRRHRLPLTDEKRMQQTLGIELERAGIEFQREFRLSRRDVVDFMVAGGLAVECKLREGKMAIFRQLQRYAAHPDVHAIVLVTNTAMGLPAQVNGKPAYYCSLGAAWL